MKRNFVFLFLLLLFVSGLNSYCFCEEIIEVTNAEEFISAIGCDRTIKLAPGEYNLSEVSPKEMEYVSWREEFDGYTVVIKNVKNLKIEGQGKDKVQIRVVSTYAYVLAFEEVEDVELKNLELGHAPETGYCTGGVVSANWARNFAINDCILFGCGTEGLTLNNVIYFEVKNSVIRNCTSGIMTAGTSTWITFDDCEFRNNREYYGFLITDCITVEFKNCIIKDNVAGSSLDPETGLFHIGNSGGVLIKGCEISNNIFNNLVFPADGAEVSDVKEEGNIKPVK